jgi:hypothetical protein
MEEPRTMQPEVAEPVESTPAPVQASRAPVDSLRGFFLELIIVTLGVFMALTVDSLRQWTQERRLVREAKATLALELRANKEDLDRKLSDANSPEKLDSALQLVNELLTTQTSSIRTFEVGFHLAELSDVSWRTAERTGALSKMDYEDVQRYSQVYDLQALYTNHQRRAIERATATIALITGDPHLASPKDLELLRQHLLAMRGDLIADRQLGERLRDRYKEILGQ